MATATVTMFNNFPREVFSRSLEGGDWWIALMNTKAGVPNAADKSPRYQFSGNGSTSFNPKRLRGARIFVDGDDLVFDADDVTFTRNQDNFYRNPEVTHVSIWWAREGARSPSLWACFFPVSWSDFDGTGKETITFDGRGIFRVSRVAP